MVAQWVDWWFVCGSGGSLGHTVSWWFDGLVGLLQDGPISGLDVVEKRTSLSVPGFKPGTIRLLE